jgi:hypothetical protein
MTWNTAFSLQPAGSSNLADGDNAIRDLKTAVFERLAQEHKMNLASGLVAEDGWHKQGSSIDYYQASAPTLRPDGVTALDSNDYGRRWVKSSDNSQWVYTASGWVNIAYATSSTIPAEMYDLVVDSNAKLDLWCQAIAGQYKRVLVKSGTWTASALSPTAGVLIDLESAGTTFVFAEPGSAIVYSGSYNGIMNGAYHATVPGVTSTESLVNVNISLTNTSAGNPAYGFTKCRNLHNCVSTVVASVPIGFYFCQDLIDCYASATANASPSNAYGYNTCIGLIRCIGIATTNHATAFAYGFSACTRMFDCLGQGVNAGAGPGYGFANHCHGMQQNGPYAASKTATYVLSYADSAEGNACANTAAGGYNS